MLDTFITPEELKKDTTYTVPEQEAQVVSAKDIIEQAEEEELPNPKSLEEAMSMGAVDLETFRKEMYEYIDQLYDEYNIK